MTSLLAAHVAEELDRPVMAEARMLVDAILETHGTSVAALLFYGSCLRTGDKAGILDIYVLTDDPWIYHGRFWPALLNTVLPPTVSYLEIQGAIETVRAKVAVMGMRAFARTARGDGMDTTIWARFCQPVALLHARDASCRETVIEAISDALAVAAGWAVRLGPDRGFPADYWITLFQHTYGAELRAEGKDRATRVHDWAAERYARLLPLALAQAGIPATTDSEGRLLPRVQHRAKARGAWARRRRVGKVLNIFRLIKAVFTFENGVDYILWKIERHSGRVPKASTWERQHPILSAPILLWRLYRNGLIR